MRKSHNVTLGSTPLLGFCLLLLAACASPTTPGPATTGSTSTDAETPFRAGILIFGDSGYHLGYPDQDDYVDLFTEEQYLDDEWTNWVADKRPPEEYRPRRSDTSPVTGRTVPATGMHIVSRAMKDFCRDLATCNFGVMLGDNIYPSGMTFGADGFDDALRFKHMITEPFGSLVENPPGFVTYATLGNHDWETSREAGFEEIAYLEKAAGFYMDGAYYSVKPPSANGQIELFIIDTSILLASVPVPEDFLNDDGSEAVTGNIDPPSYRVEPLTEADRQMHQWLEAALKASTAKWKIVVAHHPIWSSSGSKFEQARVLRQLILPAMCRYADAYLVGHEHTLEIHTDDCSEALGQPTPKPLVQVLSGAASKQRPINTNFMRHQEAKYPSLKTLFSRGLLWGFAHMQIKGDKATVQLLSVPDDGASGSTVEFTYEFERRSAN